MNNKLITILIIFFQFFFVNKIFAKEIQFNASEIEIIDEGNKTQAKKATPAADKKTTKKTESKAVKSTAKKVEKDSK